MKKTYKNEIQKILDATEKDSDVVSAFRSWNYLIYTIKYKHTGTIFQHKLDVGLNAKFEEIIEQIKLNYSQTSLLDSFKESNYKENEQ